MRRDELDQRAIDGLKGLGVESALAVLEELKGCNLQAVSNKSAYMCGIMKSLRQKLAAGLMLDSSQKRPGPDEAKLKVRRQQLMCVVCFWLLMIILIMKLLCAYQLLPIHLLSILQ